MNIQKAEVKDLQAILDLQYLAYQSEAKLLNNPDIPPLKQTLQDIRQEYEDGFILTATDAGGIIAGAVRAYSKNGTLYIGKLIVQPDLQGQGIGTKLLNEIERLYPHERYELFTSSKSMKNIRLYEHLEYKIFKEEIVTDKLKFVYLEKRNTLPL